MNIGHAVSCYSFLVLSPRVTYVSGPELLLRLGNIGEEKAVLEVGGKGE